EPESDARLALSSADERVEELFGVSRRQASVLILHLDDEAMLICGKAAHDDATSLRGVPGRVLDQVAQDRDEQLSIGEQSLFAVDLQLDLLSPSLRLMTNAWANLLEHIT